jgi:hypothetical protein
MPTPPPTPARSAPPAGSDPPAAPPTDTDTDSATETTGASTTDSATETTGAPATDDSATDTTGAPATDAADGPVPAAGPRRRWSGGRAGPGPDARLALALGLAAFGLYLRTLLPGIGYSGDSAKWQFLGSVGGTPHPTGYPLYLMLNRAFVTVVPAGSLAWRANVLSAVFGAAAVAALFQLLRALDARRAVAAATAATFAVTITFWSQAVVAEVYTLHIWLLVTVTLCLVRWRDGASERWLLAGLGLYALSFGNHLGTVLALPGVVWLVWTHRPRALTGRTAAWLVLFAAVGLAQYGYLVWMTEVGAYVEQPVRDLGDIVEILTGGRFRDRMLTFGPTELVTDRVPMFSRLLRAELGVLVLPAGYGVVRALRGRHRAVAVHLLVLGVLATVYALGFDVLDVFVFFLPAYLVLAVFLGLGLEGVARLADPVPGRRRLAAVAVAVVPLVVGVVNYPDAGQRGNLADAHRIERALAAAGSDAVLVTDNYADSEYLWYYLLGEGLGEERDLVLVDQISADQVVRYYDGRGGRLAHAAGGGRRRGAERPVYTATRHQAVALVEAGLRLDRVAPSVWRVQGLAD